MSGSARRRLGSTVAVLLVAGIGAAGALAQSPLAPHEIYEELKQFDLGGGVRQVENLTLRRDRAELTFNGRFYFETPIDGKVHGAVFLGEGAFRSDVPGTAFERDQVRRMIGSEVIESNFSRAVLRFTDDTMERIGPPDEGDASDQARSIARDFGPRLLEQTGANVASRLAVSIVNAEDPGFFLAEFDGGRLDRFVFLMDAQGRIPSVNFRINGGEKGMIFHYRDSVIGSDIWTAFYSADDFEAARADYTNAFDLVDITRFEMTVELLDPRDHMGLDARIRLVSRVDGLRAIPFAVGESLPEAEDLRQERQMMLTSARIDGAGVLEAVQEEWEGGFTVFLPESLDQGEALVLDLELEGDFILDSIAGGGIGASSAQNFYPLSNSEWYPRHGYLDRASYDLTFLHNDDYEVASSGLRASREVSGETGQATTRWIFEQDVPAATFALGLFDPYEEEGLIDDVPVAFYSIRAQRVSEEFLVAEMANAVNYFADRFGPYPYPALTGVQHPRAFGQGFASLLVMPALDTATRDAFAFIAHEIAHQWWGNTVTWRSYRDLWLSEGFAEYSGMLYTDLRDGGTSQRDLIDLARRSLINPPITDQGVGTGRLSDVGPLIMGLRLDSSQTRGAYQSLVYQKGALVLRMLHYLFSDPLTGDGTAFFEMMGDFVERHRDGWASTESFQQVASEHFSQTTLARLIGVDHLNWFFDEWVYQAFLPSYRMEYEFEEQADGSLLALGTVFQEGVPEGFFMVLPAVLRFSGDQVAYWPVLANGAQTPFRIPLPARPDRIDLDPDMWILSAETSTRRR